MKTKSLMLVAVGLLIIGLCLGTVGVLGLLWSVLISEPTTNAIDTPTSGLVALATATNIATPTQVAVSTSSIPTPTLIEAITVTSKQPATLTPMPPTPIPPTPTRVPPTPTRVPPTPISPTPTVVLASFGCPGSSGNRYLSDDFGNPQSGWATYRGADYEIFYEGNELHFQVFQPNIPAFAWKLLRDLGTRYRLEVQARKMGGPNKNGYGLLFGGQSDTTYDYFLINDAGSYQAIKKADGQTYELSSWTNTPFINQGGSNFLGLRIEGTQVTFCANGNVLTVINDPSLKSGRIGMAARSFDEPVHIHFDNFAVWKLD